jgi:hypothetical protein
MYSKRETLEGALAFTLNGTIVRERSIMWTTNKGEKVRKRNEMKRNKRKERKTTPR